MKLENKQFKINKENLSVKNIENTIRLSGGEPLRWSIVKSDKNELIIDAVVCL